MGERQALLSIVFTPQEPLAARWRRSPPLQ